MTSYYDMHCHLEFSPKAQNIAHEGAQMGISAFSVTVSPANFQTASKIFTQCPNVIVGLGLHPWWINSDQTIEEFLPLMKTTHFIGEIGLDFSPRHEATHEMQRATLERILGACGGDKLLSLHCVRSTSVVLDLLEAHQTLSQNHCIIHWFSGGSQELTRAIRLGCHFSVSTHMLGSKRGREYARVIPLHRLLLETDEPAENDEGWNAAAWHERLETTLRSVAELRHIEAEALGSQLADTSQRLLGVG